MTAFITLYLIGLAVAVVMMVGVWRTAVRIDNFGIVDIAWSWGFAVLAVLYGVLGQGNPSRRMLIAGMATLWSLRLGGYLHVRVMGHHPVEDGRYQALRKEWAANLKSKMLWFFQMQAVLLAVLSFPFLVACMNADPTVRLVEWVGVGLWAVALVGESLADRQLQNFKSDPANKGKVCQAGLWNHSRHPNYFFEWLIWVSYFVFALGSPYGWISIFCPACMFYFLFRVTGIPATEAQALKTKGDAYREYQRTTSAFIPWFKKK